MPSPQINSILDKIKQVNEHRTKNGKSLYQFNPPLSETEIQNFETKHAIRLPEDYRAFLLHVGNGNRETYSHKINPLAESDRFNPLDKEPLRLNKPFPFTGVMGQEIVTETIYDVYPASKVRSILDAEEGADIPGCLLLNYEGWGTSHIALVITGEQRGTVWHIDDLHHPFYKIAGNRFITSFSFCDWLEYTLDIELQPAPHDLISAGRYNDVQHLNLAGESQEWQKMFNLTEVFKCRNLEAFDLSRNYKITDLPEAVGMLQKLIQLKFNGGSLQKVPDALCTLKNLEILELAYQQLKTLPENIGDLDQLKRLVLYWNRDLTTLPYSLGKLKNLVHLSIGNCDALDLSLALPIIGRLHGIKNLQLTTRSVPDEIEMVTQLQALTIEKPYGEQQTILSEKLGSLYTLKILNLSNCGLVTLPKWIGMLINIEHLNLNANPLTSLPETIGNLSKLRSIDLSDTPLSELPESFSTLTNLSEVKIDRCTNLNFKNIFQVLGRMPNITMLSIHVTKEIAGEIGALVHVKTLILTSATDIPQTIPTSVASLENLERLIIRLVGELIIPQALTQLRQLKVLIVEAKQIALPDSIEHLKNLKELDLRCDEGLKNLPSGFDQLKNLETLYLDGPHELDWETAFRSLARLPNLRHLTIATKKLPPEVGLCTQLETLAISNHAEDDPRYNDALILPQEIGRLKQLKELRLYENRLKELPESIGELSNLTYLDISDNQLKNLPPQLFKLPLLRQLYITKNLFDKIPHELAGMTSLIETDFLPE